MRAVIFANGEIKQPESLKAKLRSDDILIAADGGAVCLQALNLLPDAVIGDFDSLDAEVLQGLQDAGVKILRYPAKKDQTDLELALDYARTLGAEEILLLGALGNRWDQTLANLLLPAASAFSSLGIRLMDGNQEISLIRSGQTRQIQGKAGDTLSLIPLAGDARDITTQGLEYPLDGETLLFGSTRGVSNVLLGDTASVSLKEGMLLCTIIRGGEKGKTKQDIQDG